jgi:multimeric flavodoxin WrbA
MKIVVLNGSPKGDVSVTMQYIKYLEKRFPDHQLKIINIAQNILKIEKDSDYFDSIIKDINQSDGIIWAFPLYVFLVSSQYKRFIELIFERNTQYAFKNKYTSVLATSIHFYDHTAVNYINAICDDLDMKYVDFLSVHMYDLQKASIRKVLINFANNFFDSIANNKITFRNFLPINFSPIEYKPTITSDKIKNTSKKVIVLADSLKDNNLSNMINKFKDSISGNIEVMLLEDVDIKGGCLGCMKCGYNFECTYLGKDEYIDFFNNKIRTADVIVFASSIKDRYLSSTFKRFFDRAFFNTHTPSITNKQIGFIISGPLKQNSNLKQILEAFIQWQGSNLIGFVTDEQENSSDIDAQIYHLAETLLKASEQDYLKPATYLGVGGMKIFRDDIYGNIRVPFIADYKAYKKLNLFDFPQKRLITRLRNIFVPIIMKIPAIRKEFYNNQLKPGMLIPLKKIVDDPNM